MCIEFGRMHKSHLSTGAAISLKGAGHTCARLVNLRPKRCKDINVRNCHIDKARVLQPLCQLQSFLMGCMTLSESGRDEVW